MYRIRYLYLSLAAVFVALAIGIPAQAAQPLRRGLSDLRVYETHTAVQSMPSEQAHQPVLKRGLSDFGLSAGQISRLLYGEATSSTSQPITSVEPVGQDEFHWGDAGIGAGFAAGIAVLLGAVVAVAGLRKRHLKGA